MILYVNGCSWSIWADPTCTDKSYGNYLSEKLTVPLINHAVNGASNNKIFRSTVRNLQKIIKTEKDIICVLNISTLFRIDLWDSEHKIRQTVIKGDNPKVAQFMRSQLQSANDGECISCTCADTYMHSVIDQFPEYALQFKSFVTNYNYEQAYYDLYYQLFMLVTYLKQNNIKYLIFAGAQLHEHDGSLDHHLDWISTFRDPIINDPAILDFEKINFCHWAYDNGHKTFDGHLWRLDPTGRPYGHPDTKAHAAWADFLYNKLTELYGPL